MKKKSSEITLKGLLNIFLPQWWIILIISFVCAALLGVFSYMKPDTYTSTGKYMISKVNMSDSSAQTGLNAQEVEAMHVMIENASEMIKTNNFAEKVRERLNDQADSKGKIDLSTEEIKKMMSVTLTSQDTTCYYFSVTYSDPEIAKKVADVAGELLVEEYKDKTVYAVEIARIDDPVVPKSTNSKNVVRNAVIGGAGGLFLALILVFVLSRFDVVIRTRDKLEETFDIPILGVIPRLEVDN